MSVPARDADRRCSRWQAFGDEGVDTVAWIKANPGRGKSIHLNDWAPGTKEEEKADRMLFAEGIAP